METCLMVNSDMVPPAVELQISVSNDSSIRAVIIFAEGIFPGESFVT
ncbi:unnamed protein product [Toxocara canis]|uniref:BBS2 GAE domain-containing protein n=1 Tax=Toxocara canis TaxID=6265 RepID=A0A3P7G0G9_TOXCA|nr:unnamed protein product [Toxocara canis]